MRTETHQLAIEILTAQQAFNASIQANVAMAHETNHSLSLMNVAFTQKIDHIDKTTAQSGVELKVLLDQKIEEVKKSVTDAHTVAAELDMKREGEMRSEMQGMQTGELLVIYL